MLHTAHCSLPTSKLARCVGPCMADALSPLLFCSYCRHGTFFGVCICVGTLLHNRVALVLQGQGTVPQSVCSLHEVSILSVPLYPLYALRSLALVQYRRLTSQVKYMAPVSNRQYFH